MTPDVSSPTDSELVRLRRRKRLLALGRTLAAVAVLAGTVVYFRDLDLRELGRSLVANDWRLTAVAALLNLGPLTLARVMRWRALLPRDTATGRLPDPRFLCRVNLAAYAASNVLPFRAGEAWRTTSLRERHGHAWHSIIAVQLVEKLVEAMSLTTFALPVALFPRPTALPMVLGLATAGALAVLGIARLGRLRGTALRWPWLARAGEAFHSLESRRAWIMSFGWALVSDLIDLTMIGLCLAAVGLHVPFLTSCAVLVGVNLASLLPSSPGQIGLVEAGAVLALASSGVGQPQALAFALLYHAAHLVPTTVGGGLVLAAGELSRLRAPRPVRR